MSFIVTLYSSVSVTSSSVCEHHPISADSVYAVSVIGDLPQREKNRKIKK
jgi:hypothetical protein